MKTKKMIGGLFVAAAITVGIFYACKKPGGKTQTTTEQNELIAQSSSSTDRSTGTQTYYSKDSAGTYYKIILTWNSAGNVSVNRSIVTSGYPAGTQTWYRVENGISMTKVDLDPSTPNEIDTLKLNLNIAKQYFIISFKPNSAGGYIRYPLGRSIRGGNNALAYCQCQTIAGGECKLNQEGNSFYCTKKTCEKCNIVSSGCPTSYYVGISAYLLPKFGCIAVEASGITIVR